MSDCSACLGMLTGRLPEAGQIGRLKMEPE